MSVYYYLFTHVFLRVDVYCDKREELDRELRGVEDSGRYFIFEFEETYMIKKILTFLTIVIFLHIKIIRQVKLGIPTAWKNVMNVNLKYTLFRLTIPLNMYLRTWKPLTIRGLRV